MIKHSPLALGEEYENTLNCRWLNTALGTVSFLPIRIPGDV